MCKRFVVHTNLASFHWILTIEYLSGRLMRWRLRLTEFDFEVKYKKGKSNVQADALSRLDTAAETVPVDNDDIPTLAITEDIFVVNCTERDHDCSNEVHFIGE